MQLLWTLVYLVTTIYFFILVVRILYSLVNVFVRDWRPRGMNLIIAELVMTLTDPPLRFFRRFITTAATRTGPRNHLSSWYFSS